MLYGCRRSHVVNLANTYGSRKVTGLAKSQAFVRTAREQFERSELPRQGLSECNLDSGSDRSLKSTIRVYRRSLQSLSCEQNQLTGSRCGGTRPGPQLPHWRSSSMLSQAVERFVRWTQRAARTPTSSRPPSAKNVYSRVRPKGTSIDGGKAIDRRTPRAKQSARSLPAAFG